MHAMKKTVGVYGIILLGLLISIGCKQEVQVVEPEIDLITATTNGDLQTVSAHIAIGSDLNAVSFDSSTPLIIAATFGHTEIAKQLIAAGADVNKQKSDGTTALHAATFLCRKEIVQALLDAGADKSIKTKDGSTALDGVSGPFGEMKPIYDLLQTMLGPLGLKLDYNQIQAERPVIAEMLK